MTQPVPVLSATEQRKRLVIKVGTSTVSTKEGLLDIDYLQRFASDVAQVRNMGFDPIIVSSGAVGCGLEILGIHDRPRDLPSLQAAASVGQSALASAYTEAFAPFGLVTSTVLLTRRDTADRNAYLHARDTLNKLIELSVVPIVNENDTVSVEQIRFGDNDTLAALTACLVKADLLVVFSDVEGLFDAPPGFGKTANLIERVERIDEDLMSVAKGAGSTAGSGGMITKLRAARILMAAGIFMHVCHGRRENALIDIVSGKKVGTCFVPHAQSHEITPRKLWIALGDVSRGSVYIDQGAMDALVKRGSSLLVVGIRSVSGSFVAGDIVDIVAEDNRLLGRGISAFSRDAVELALGKSRDEICHNMLIASLAGSPVVHRDDLLLFE